MNNSRHVGMELLYPMDLVTKVRSTMINRRAYALIVFLNTPMTLLKLIKLEVNSDQDGDMANQLKLCLSLSR